MVVLAECVFKETCPNIKAANYLRTPIVLHVDHLANIKLLPWLISNLSSSQLRGYPLTNLKLAL